MKARGTRGAAHRAERVFRAKRKGCPPGCPGWSKRGARVFQSARVAELTPGGPRNHRVTVSSEGGSAIAREGSGEGELDVRQKRPVRRWSVAEGAAVIGRHVSARCGRADLGDEAGQRHAIGELIGGAAKSHGAGGEADLVRRLKWVVLGRDQGCGTRVRAGSGSPAGWASDRERGGRVRCGGDGRAQGVQIFHGRARRNFTTGIDHEAGPGGGTAAGDGPPDAIG